MIREVAAKKFSTQKQRNRIACMAMILTTFMIYTICSIGMSFWDSIELGQIRSAGADADFLLADFSKEQAQVLKDCGLCSHVGFCTKAAALSRSVTERFGISGASFLYADDTFLGRQLKPALSGMEGDFPEKENEILIPDWFAEKIGVSAGQTGTAVRLTVYYGGVDAWFNRLSDDMEMEFVISGIYEDLSSYYLHNTANIYVSNSFWQKAPFPKEQFKAAAYISLKKGIGRQELADVLGLTKEQELVALKSSYAQEGGGVLEVFLAVFIVILSGALMIYNVLSLSEAQDVRFLGQMKTLGVTKRQLKKYLRYQIRWLCLAAIPSGLALAVPVSVILVPLAVRSFNSSIGQVSVSFSPFLFAGTILLSLCTAALGSFRPLHVAGSVSPVLASRYVNVSSRKKVCRQEHNGICSIAWRNVFRSRKNAVTVFLSLFLAIVIFFTLDGLLSGFSSAAFVGNTMYS